MYVQKLNMRKIITIALPFFLLTASLPSFAQESYVNWKTSPAAHTISAIYAKESAVILEDERVHEYKKEGKDEMYIHTHTRKLIKLNDEKSVEMYNKIYVYVPGNGEVVEIKARAMQPNGKVVDLPADKILDVEEDNRHYKKFALEGIEKGSEIEYYVHIKKQLSTFGMEIFTSSKTPFEKASFTLIVPAHLVFSVKGYNGITVGADTVIDDKRIVVATGKNINAFDEEKYAASSPYEQNVQYKLSYNLDKDKSVRLFTWNELAKNVYSNYNSFDDKELKVIGNFYKQIKLKDDQNPEAKIIAIEDYLKSNISSDENAISEDADKIEHIIKTKVGGKFGVTRLFIGLLQKAEIGSQIVFPSKRDDLPIDEEFENYNLVDNMLLYFPSTGKFLDPINIAFRYPYVDPYSAGTTGLFLKGTTIGDFKTAIASFDSIPLIPYEKSFHNVDVDVKFNEEMDSLRIHSKQSLAGYGAANYRPVYNYVPKDRQDEFTKDIIKSVGYSDAISNIKIENSAMTDGSKDLPLNIIADISTAALTEKAGDKFLIKIGDVIGPQEQLYQEKKRQLPILIQYPHALDRVINFTIPKGYMITNLYDINIENTDKEKTMGFISSYTLKDSLLTIKIHEYYKQVNYPVSSFEPFRKVINASADFNKVVLVLEKN